MIDSMTNDLFSLLDQFQQSSILVIGDIMLDHYIFGEVVRISPEAPVPVVQVRDEKYSLGGAGNVARICAQFGAKTFLVGAVGSDAFGKTIQEHCNECSIQSILHSFCERPTTVKSRVLAQNQQITRIDYEDASAFSCDDSNQLLNHVSRLLPNISAVILSDYGKGLVTPYFYDQLQELLDSQSQAIPLFIDPKVPNCSLYHDAYLLTPNLQEAFACAQMNIATSFEQIALCGQQLFSNLHCQHLLITLGGLGMALFESPDSIWHIPTVAKKVFDVTGAGDAVIAVFALGISCGGSLIQSAMLANFAAGSVVGQIGTGSIDTRQLKEILLNAGSCPANKLKL